MKVEQLINQKLNQYPGIKKVIKRAYQFSMYIISKKVKSLGNITKISPDDLNHEYFFGYYDKSPWDATNRYVLCLKANNTWKDVSPKEIAEIILIDTQNNNSVRTIARTHTWNVQMGCMMQWLGPDFSSKIIFNDYRNNKYCSVVIDINSLEERVFDMPIFSVSNDGKTALTLDFSRLYRLRPGYGYYNVEEVTANEKIPDTTCIWKLSLETGEVQSILSYKDLYNFETRSEMKNAEHKVNHIMISPNGKRFMVLHRWFKGHHKYTRLVTCNIDGRELYNLSDDDMVSHCFWKDDNHIIAFENKKLTGVGYYLMKEQSKEYTHLWAGIDDDGHPSYSPDGKLIVFDTYPDRARIASIRVSGTNNSDIKYVKTIARVFAPFKYDNDTRCDLHPRWDRLGKKICFDSVFEGKRGLYVLNIDEEEVHESFTNK